MRNEPRSSVLSFPTEERILRYYLQENPTDSEMLKAMEDLEERMLLVRPQVGAVMFSIIEALRSELHGL